MMRDFFLDIRLLVTVIYLQFGICHLSFDIFTMGFSLAGGKKAWYNLFR